MAGQDEANDIEVTTEVVDQGEINDVEAAPLKSSDEAAKPTEVDGQGETNDTEAGTLNTSDAVAKHQEQTVADKKKKRRVLQPDEEVLALEDLPPLATWIYVVCYVAMAVYSLGMLWLSITQVSKPAEFVFHTFGLNGLLLHFIFYIAGALNVFAGLKAAYSRKIIHISAYTLPLIVDALFDRLNDDDAPYSLGWYLWQIEFWMLLIAIPTRNAFDKCLGNVRDESNAKWKRYLNYPSLNLAGVDRPEDRPNTIKWLQTQLVVGMFLNFLIVGIAEAVNVIPVETVLVIPSMVVGFGDGLAEPVGRKWGANYQFTVHGCCSEHDYTRSYPGSFMVWLAGVVTIIVYYNSFSTIQLIIALIVIPVVGTVAEAKAPHTLDNPIIQLSVAMFVMLVAALPL